MCGSLRPPGVGGREKSVHWGRAQTEKDLRVSLSGRSTCLPGSLLYFSVETADHTLSNLAHCFGFLLVGIENSCPALCLYSLLSLSNSLMFGSIFLTLKSKRPIVRVSRKEKKNLNPRKLWRQLGFQQEGGINSNCASWNLENFISFSSSLQPAHPQGPHCP